MRRRDATHAHGDTEKWYGSRRDSGHVCRQKRAQQRAQLPINVKNIRGYASRRTWALWPGMDCLVLSRAAIGPRDAATRQLANVRSAHWPLGSELWPMGA